MWNTASVNTFLTETCRHKIWRISLVCVEVGMKYCSLLLKTMNNITLVRSWYLRGCWGIQVALTEEVDGILWSIKATLVPLRPMRPWAAGTREPVWVNLDWKRCCSNTLSLAAGHKAIYRKNQCRISNSIGWGRRWGRTRSGEGWKKTYERI